MATSVYEPARPAPLPASAGAPQQVTIVTVVRCHDLPGRNPTA